MSSYYQSVTRQLPIGIFSCSFKLKFSYSLISYIKFLFRHSQYTTTMSLHLLHYLKHNNLQDNQPLPLGFEKNYPKNIFIPVVEFLTSLGLKQHYEMCVGTREYYETKNVVSLSVLFKLISQPWFKHNVDKTQLLRVVSNKLLVNSKIKKKAFHLKMAELILNSTYVDERDFKH